MLSQSRDIFTHHIFPNLSAKDFCAARATCRQIRDAAAAAPVSFNIIASIESISCDKFRKYIDCAALAPKDINNNPAICIYLGLEFPFNVADTQLFLAAFAINPNLICDIKLALGKVDRGLNRYPLECECLCCVGKDKNAEICWLCKFKCYECENCCRHAADCDCSDDDWRSDSDYECDSDGCLDGCPHSEPSNLTVWQYNKSRAEQNFSKMEHDIAEDNFRFIQNIEMLISKQKLNEYIDEFAAPIIWNISASWCFATGNIDEFSARDLCKRLYYQTYMDWKAYHLPRSPEFLRLIFTNTEFANGMFYKDESIRNLMKNSGIITEEFATECIDHLFKNMDKLFSACEYLQEFPTQSFQILCTGIVNNIIARSSLSVDISTFLNLLREQVADFAESYKLPSYKKDILDMLQFDRIIATRDKYYKQIDIAAAHKYYSRSYSVFDKWYYEKMIFNILMGAEDKILSPST